MTKGSTRIWKDMACIAFIIIQIIIYLLYLHGISFSGYERYERKIHIFIKKILSYTTQHPLASLNKKIL